MTKLHLSYSPKLFLNVLSRKTIICDIMVQDFNRKHEEQNSMLFSAEQYTIPLSASL